MNAQIIKKLNEHGGNTENVSNEKSFVDNWQSVKFNHPLFDKDWDVYGIDKFYGINKELYKTDKDRFYSDLLAHYFSDHELFYGQDFFRDWMFTPFKKNTRDFGELGGPVEENAIREIVEGSEMDFICIFYSYGFPEHYFICTTDADQQNPTVYSTDHEVYFQEIENEGTLEDFLERYMTKEEFTVVVKEYLEGKFGE